MATTAVSGNSYLNSLVNTGSTSSSATTKSSGALGETDFMNLLMTQMKNQDPLDPMKDTDFMAQLAQFSSLQAMTSLNTTMSSFVQQQNLINASAMIGKQVTTSSGQTGIVTKVGTDGSSVSLYIGSQQISLSDITNISNPAS